MVAGSNSPLYPQDEQSLGSKLKSEPSLKDPSSAGSSPETEREEGVSSAARSLALLALSFCVHTV